MAWKGGPNESEWKSRTAGEGASGRRGWKPTIKMEMVEGEQGSPAVAWLTPLIECTKVWLRLAQARSLVVVWQITGHCCFLVFNLCRWYLWIRNRERTKNIEARSFNYYKVVRHKTFLNYLNNIYTQGTFPSTQNVPTTRPKHNSGKLRMF